MIYLIKMEMDNMKNILCYGDSNTWGYDSKTDARFSFDKRWTGRLSKLLPEGYRVIEEGLCGRTTKYELPLESGRNGWHFYPVALSSTDPIDLVVLMLGTNDRRKNLRIAPQESALALEQYIQLTRATDLWGGRVKPQILIVSPPEIDPIVLETSVAFYYDEESVATSKKLKECYKELADKYGCAFLDAAAYCRVGKDGVHLDEDGHKGLAEAMSKLIIELL